MLLKIPVEIVLLNMTLNISIKGEASLVPLVLEGLDLLHNCVPRGDNLLSPQEMGMQRPEGLASILGLVETLAMSPPGRLAPDGVEYVINDRRVSDEARFEGSFHLKGLVVLA